eukprot:gnl/TRDRNA2_/TRDRNA2_58743_c0_seq1.p1 gnl/TRDRNA2_/TRDRNA2_58743_c0~~gnl/TRDRNA2_/TRDRNA2_58743_c0_seq1.p1  ORF type:complete len:509 (+),score=168.54 gnl/TRDRNA2_/TRDRNA2_58743_c0_seq1:88-1614(+)
MAGSGGRKTQGQLPDDDAFRDSTAAKLDLDNPRILAAMKVTGVTEKDLEYRPMGPDDGKKGAVAERAESKRMMLLDMQERKRQALIREVETTASALNDADIEQLLSPRLFERAEMADEVRELYDKEKASIDKYREKVKLMMQNEASKAMEQKQTYEHGNKSNEEYKKRLKEKHDEKMEEVAKKKEEVMKKTQKIAEAQVAHAKAEFEKRKEIMTKMKSDAERVGKKKDDDRSMWNGIAEDRRRKMADIATRNMENLQADQQRRVEEHQDRERELEMRMQAVAERREAQVSDKRTHMDNKMREVSNLQVQQAQDRENAWKETSRKLTAAREQAVVNKKELVEQVKTKKQVFLDKYTTNRQNLRQQRREFVNKLKAEVNESTARVAQVREQHHAGTLGRAIDQREVMKSIVAENKARLERSQDCVREQTLAKIQATREKADTLISQREELSAYRIFAQKEYMIGRAQLEELKLAMRDSSLGKANNILKELDIAPIEKRVVKEGEEGEQKQ